MTSRTARVLAGGVLVVTLLMVIAWIVWRADTAGAVPIYAYWGEAIAVAFAFPTLGYLIVRHQPDNRVGWLFVVLGATAGPELVLGQTAIALRSGWLGLFSETLRLGGFFAVGYLVLLYPTGHLLSPRWRWAGWLLGFGIVAAVGSIVLTPGPIEGVPSVDNPIASPSLRPIGTVLELMTLVVLVAVVAGIVSLIMRFRRSATVGRQQIKLFAITPAVIVVVLIVANILLPKQMEGPLGSILWGSPAVLLPAAATIAITRHGLYDIDRIISRTVSYAIVTVVLAGVFALLVLAPVLLGVDEAPDYLIAAATLIVAALFRPVRRRVQDAVDHRFNRKRYDADRTIEAFTARLREQVDIDALGAELRTVVERTMQPSRVTLWLRPESTARTR